MEYSGCRFKVRSRELFTAPPSHSCHDCHSSFTQTDRIVCILTVLCCLPSLHNRLMPLLLLHRRCSHLCSRILDPSRLLLLRTPIFGRCPRFGGLDSFQVIWRMSGVVWGGSDPHIFVGRNIPPTLIRWHNVTFHVYCTRDVPTSGQTSS